MVCQGCKFEFCWLCLGSYRGYQHQESTLCPLRWLVVQILMYSAIVMLNTKMGFLFPVIFAYEWLVVSAVLLFIGVHLHFASFAIEIMYI